MEKHKIPNSLSALMFLLMFFQKKKYSFHWNYLDKQIRIHVLRLSIEAILLLLCVSKILDLFNSNDVVAFLKCRKKALKFTSFSQNSSFYELWFIKVWSWPLNKSKPTNLLANSVGWNLTNSVCNACAFIRPMLAIIDMAWESRATSLAHLTKHRNNENIIKMCLATKQV